jgi:hypothetical protein
VVARLYFTGYGLQDVHMSLLTGPALVCAAVALNLPFGAYRATVTRFSVRWFLAIHLPIPFIFLLRISAGYGYSFIPWLFVGAVSGQIAGARLWSWRGERRAGPATLSDADTSEAAD